MFHRSICVPSAIAIAAATATVLAGPIWDCIDPKEPGGTPGTAQEIRGSGPLSTVQCELTGQAALLIDDPDGDFQDMFLVRIADPEQFEMRTVVPMDGIGFNTQIWLFDLDGKGILANTLDPDNPPFSFMGNAANDGSGSMVVSPGLYYIAISGGDEAGRGRHPVDADGIPIFNFDPNKPHLVYGPLSPNAVTAWKGEGEIGEYQIELVGVEFVPPDVPTLTQWGAILLALLLLTAGTLVIRQHHRQSAIAAA